MPTTKTKTKLAEILVERDILQRLAFAASRSDAGRYVLEGVHICPHPRDPDDAMAVATDGKILAAARLFGVAKAGGAEVPTVTIAGGPLRRLLKKGKALDISVEGAVTFDRDTVVRIGAVEGDYPDFEWVLAHARHLQENRPDGYSLNIRLLARADRILDLEDGHVQLWRNAEYGRPDVMFGRDVLLLVMPLSSGAKATPWKMPRNPLLSV